MRQILLDVMTDTHDGSILPGAGVWERLCTQATNAVPVSGAGVALMTPAGHGGTLAATDGPAAAMENLQLTLGEGPCLDAARDRRPVLEADLVRSGMTRWPGFGPAAVDAGIAAIFAFPLQIGAISLGVLDLYRNAPGSLDTLQFGEALDFAAAATTILLDQQHEAGPGRLHSDLAEATDSHREIHQATGMISAQATVGLTDALLLLRAHAYSHDRSLLDVAKDVVARIVTFAPEDDHRE